MSNARKYSHASHVSKRKKKNKKSVVEPKEEEEEEEEEENARQRDRFRRRSVAAPAEIQDHISTRVLCCVTKKRTLAIIFFSRTSKQKQKSQKHTL